MFKQAEKIGNMIAGSREKKPIIEKTSPKTQPQGTIPAPITLSSSYVFFQIKPFKDNDRGVNHRDTVSKNIISLKKKKIIFMISGNTSDIKLYV